MRSIPASGTWWPSARVRRPGVDEDRLTAYDDWAHHEAMKAPGFVHYFKGPTKTDGLCMSFCLWNSRTEARDAAGRPAHTQAAALTHEAYQSTPSNSTESAGLPAGLHVRAVRRAGREPRAA